MEDIVFRISRHYLSGIIGIIGLCGVTWALRRYLSNTEKTQNKYYTKPEELNNQSSLSILRPARDNIYIFWNGSVNSTYLLIDYLQQDKIIQPLYIERYTIRKALEHDLLERYTAQYTASKSNPGIRSEGTGNSSILEYLSEVARMKKTQMQELAQLAILRRIIINQYSEFTANFLPTKYITVIEKDLDFSQAFYDSLRELKLAPVVYTGIELYEQAARYISHLQAIDSSCKIVMGYSRDSHLTPVILKLLATWKELNRKNGTRGTNEKHRLGWIGLPLARTDNETIKYLASNSINREVMRFLYVKQG